MNQNTNEPLCSTCSHKEVCALKETFKKAQIAVDDCHVYMGEDENGYVLKKLPDCDFIERVKLTCRYYRRNPLVEQTRLEMPKERDNAFFRCRTLFLIRRKED